MPKTMKELFNQEKRDPLSIRGWLLSQGLLESSINVALFDHAQRIANGEIFGYKDGISILSNSIRFQAEKSSLEEGDKVLESFGTFDKTSTKGKFWKFLNKPLF